MIKDPSLFIQEKLAKKVLSINTIRDGIFAALILALQKKAEKNGEVSQLESWRKEISGEIRKKASTFFASIEAPFEYPTLAQLKTVIEKIKTAYRWDQLPDQEKEVFEARAQSLYAKFEN